jgi:hypothetical protein
LGGGQGVHRLPHSEGLHAAEDAVGRKVEWTVTLDDPTTWTRPWTYSYPMTINDEKPIFEYACHEGNFGMSNLLSAGRLADKQGGFGVKK